MNDIAKTALDHAEAISAEAKRRADAFADAKYPAPKFQDLSEKDQTLRDYVARSMYKQLVKTSTKLMAAMVVAEAIDRMCEAAEG